MICLSETYLDFPMKTMIQDKLKDLSLIRVDNIHNCKRGGVSIYFKEYLVVSPVSQSHKFT